MDRKRFKFVAAVAIASGLYACGTEAQTGTMLNHKTLHGAAPYGSPIADGRTYVHGVFNQLEGRVSSSSYLRWDGQAWAGSDYNRLWFKSEGRFNADNKQEVGDGDTELLYDRPITTYFDVQVA